MKSRLINSRLLYYQEWIMSQHCIIQFTLYYLSSGRLREVKNKRKFQAFSSESGHGRLEEVPNIVIWLENFWYFGNLVAEERWLLTRSGRNWRFDCKLHQISVIILFNALLVISTPLRVVSMISARFQQGSHYEHRQSRQYHYAVHTLSRLKQDSAKSNQVWPCFFWGYWSANLRGGYRLKVIALSRLNNQVFYLTQIQGWYVWGITMHKLIK